MHLQTIIHPYLNKTYGTVPGTIVVEVSMSEKGSMSTTFAIQKKASTAVTSTSLLSSSTDLFNMLGISSPVSDPLSQKQEPCVLSDRSYVICAVLDDANHTHVRIGSAQYCTSTHAYHMIGGSLKILESSRSENDGLYRNDIGTYALMTEEQFAQVRQPTLKQLANTNTQSSSVGTDVVPNADFLQASKTTVVPPTTRLNVTPNRIKGGIGCGPGSETKSVFVAGNFEGDSSRLDVVMQQSKALALKAAKRGNKVIYAFMGNVMPDVHRAGRNDDNFDSVSKIIQMAESGIELAPTHSVSARDVSRVTNVQTVKCVSMTGVRRPDRWTTRTGETAGVAVG